MEGPVSDRLLDQRLRNRVMESLWSLEDGPGRWGAVEYIQQFYDQMDDNRPKPNDVMSEEEAGAIADMCRLMNQACEETPRDLTEDDLRRTGWLDRIQSKARSTLAIFLRRGRFGEDVEEVEPSFEAGNVWYRPE